MYLLSGSGDFLVSVMIEPLRAGSILGHLCVQGPRVESETGKAVGKLANGQKKLASTNKIHVGRRRSFMSAV